MMKRTLLLFTSLILLVIMLSGCMLGGRRAGDRPEQVQSQPQQAASAVPGSVPVEQTPAAPLQNTGEMVPTKSESLSEETPNVTVEDPGQNLIDLINALDAANQAGDPLSDLP
jgi:hypothetical protein